MNRLTREEIEHIHEEATVRYASLPKMQSPDGLTKLIAYKNMALQSLSQEAVRDEALEEAARRCEAAIAELDITDEVLKVDDYFKGFKAAVETRARAIRALKREPNAAGKIGQSYEVMGIEQAPAPAVPDVVCCCAAHHPNHGRCLQCPIHGTLPPGASDD